MNFNVGIDFLIKENPVGAIFGDDEINAVARVMRSGKTLAYGENRDQFEAEFAEYVGAEHCITTSSGTTALDLAVMILCLKEGDEVISTPQSFRATYLKLASKNITIKFADVFPDTLNMDPSTIEDKITDRTKAIMIMDYAGNPNDMDAIMAIARKHDLKVIEDAAHAPGAGYRGRKIGSIADLTCFSFQSLKNMSLGGEGGAVTTNDDELAAAALEIRAYGILGEKKERETPCIGPYKPLKHIYDHASFSYTHDWTHIDEIGTNMRITEMQAAIGLVQLAKLDKFNEMRIAIAQKYNEAFNQVEGLRTLKIDPQDRCVYHLYPVFIDPEVLGVDLQGFIDYLQFEKRIQIILRFFPATVSDYMVYKGHKLGESPVCEKVWFEQQVNIPINPKMTEAEVAYVISSVVEAAEHFKSKK
ncbi:DegT/DnrJ/EryC1/StrS family aminotransferase [Lacrimispora sp. NSJ-141]|uniref:DegT/DnrJ/EryC1/StrS family aminotransferase n=1 Tax=Lientehia hominis TaxID=2897778 RepID=A0AAP2RLH0_9FIRM|nr:DegT/DnrJ/EryC1/StrS family aminotransferase [Lientehia hominis]MCD2493193.1 DegT/DnrJ/EryC1/StrS family aminotransferase [Lientehia hominis]